MTKRILYLALTVLFVACNPNTKEKTALKVPFQKFELENGLEVVFHVDKSDPVVAVALTAHVGSSREKIKRTGFAHLFEHLLFLESENLGKGGLDKMSARIGGSGANGSTSRDRTNYFQTVPKDALEKMIWAEADKLGWFINTVTEEVLAKEKEVVKNEKRQRVDNQPYGHNGSVIDKNLYDESHPYNWQVIGSLEDLQNATLTDVKDFFKKWYVPNNVTLVISGDFDEKQAKAWVHKYFDEIPRGEEIKPLPKRAGKVENTIKLYHEDNFARTAQLTMVWPTVEMYHKDSYALDILTQYLSSGKKAPLNKVLVEDKKLTSGVSMYNMSSELAGQLQISARAFAGKDLNAIAAAIEEGFAKFEKEGISEKDLKRIKAGQETQFYNGLSSALGKGFQLAQYNIFAGDPGFIQQDIQNLLDVTAADVMRVYNTYIKGKNYIATSFVPKGQVDLALNNSKMAEIVEEKIEIGKEKTFDPSIAATYEKTPSTFDRSIEPPYGPTPEIKVPTVWKDQLSNGIQLYGIENTEVPLVQFNLVIKGGQLLEDVNKTGVANLMARMLTKGTKNKTPQELEEAIQDLGASINVYASKESIRITGNTLARNYDAVISLIEEIILEPRWDAEEFELLKQSVLSTIQQLKANPGSIAQNEYDKLMYGDDNIRSKNILGTLESVNSITMDDLKEFYQKNISPSVTKMHIVGAKNKGEIITSLENISQKWESKDVKIPTEIAIVKPTTSTVYFYDVPNAKQSVINVGYPALAVTDKDYYPANIMNYKLGGGGFASKLTQELREGKGYTYGIGSGFSGSKNTGTFTISSNVRTNVTLESLKLIKDILNQYGKDFSENDLETTKGYLIKSNSRAFETAGAKLGMLETISTYNFNDNYVKEREQIVKEITVEDIQRLSEEYLNANKMIWLVVGDAKTQLPRLKALGFGEPVLLNKTKNNEKIKL